VREKKKKGGEGCGKSTTASGWGGGKRSQKTGSSLPAGGVRVKNTCKGERELKKTEEGARG